MFKMAICGLMIVAAAGCGSSSAMKPEPQAVPEAAVTPISPAPGGQTEPAGAEHSAIPLHVLKWEGVQELVAQKQGSIVVVDIWATYCPPCVAEFPNLVKLHGKYGERVACISVSADFDGLDDKPAEAHREKVLAFLTKHGARFDNVLLATDAEALFSEKIPQQSLPVVYVYDRQGKLAGQFPDPANPSEFTYAEHITPLVEKLLADQ